MEVFWVDAAGGAEDVGGSEPGGHAAEMSPHIGGAEGSEEAASEDAFLNDTLRAVEGVGKDRCRTRMGDDRTEALTDLGDGVVPGDWRELAGTLRSGSSQRREDPVGVMYSIEEAVDLGAQLALGGGVVGESTKGNGSTVLHGDLPHARVGTVVMTRAADDSCSHRANGAFHRATGRLKTPGP